MKFIPFKNNQMTIENLNLNYFVPGCNQKYDEMIQRDVAFILTIYSSISVLIHSFAPGGPVIVNKASLLTSAIERLRMKKSQQFLSF